MEHSTGNPAFDQLLDKAKGQYAGTKKLLQKAKKVKPGKLDQLFHEAHDETFEVVDCLTCANCCKTTSPIFREKDIDRLSSHLKMKSSNFIETYLKKDTDGLWMLQSSPCAFLGTDNYCSVYSARPGACREYPHTDRKNMHQITALTARNTLVCPAVHLIVEKIRKGLQR
jgi:uncharacterized protein